MYSLSCNFTRSRVTIDGQSVKAEALLWRGPQKRKVGGNSLNLLFNKALTTPGTRQIPRQISNLTHSYFFPPTIDTCLNLETGASVMPQHAHTVTSFVKQGVRRITTAPPTQGNLTQQTVSCYKLKWENLKAFLETRFPNSKYPKLEFKERIVRCWSQHDLLIQSDLLVLRSMMTVMCSWPPRL